MDGSHVLVIPAYKPGEELPGYVAALRAACGCPVLLVDDGSGPEKAEVFRRCAETAGVETIAHDRNRGKGRALKTAFGHLLRERPGVKGCVTCDCDGQHAPEDVARCLAELKSHPEAVVLGCRQFGLKQVPWKSRLGNRTMRALFRLTTGRAVDDTQTGLRALPAEFMREMLSCPGEGFEFETRMLLRLGGRELAQVPIRTLYDGGNRGTHFKAVRDSARILWVLAAGFAKRVGAFALASLLSFGVDMGLFALLFYRVLGEGAAGRLFWSVALARVVSVVFNYACNRYVVFGEGRRDRRFDGRAFRRYAGLAAGIMAASYALTRAMAGMMDGVEVPWVKAGVDTALFAASYAVQRMAIFR